MRLPNERIWFPLHGGDWLRRTSHLPAAARGHYLDLVAWLWADDRVVPDHEVTLMQVTRCTSAREFRASWPLIRPLLVDADGGLRDPWVDDCRRKHDAYTASQSRKGKLSAAARATGRQPESNRNPTGQSTGGPPGGPTERQPSDPDPKQVQQDQGLTPRRGGNGMAKWHDEKPSIRVMTRVAHEILDEQDAGIIPRNCGDGELSERLKQRAADYRLAYDSTTVQKALESARWQKARNGRGVGPVPSEAPVDCAAWLVAELLKYHGGTMTREALNKVVFEAAGMQWEDAGFRDAVLRLAWQDDTLKLFPQWFDVAGTEIRLKGSR